MHIRRATFLILVLPILLATVAAYIQWLLVGLPPVPTSSQGLFDAAHQQGFPHWIGIAHYINLLFIILLIRSGLQILLDHPRLYWNVGCKPGTEWIRFTPVKLPPVELPADRVSGQLRMMRAISRHGSACPEAVTRWACHGTGIF